MELYLIRHGLPEREERVEGPTDPPLAPEGHAQARALAAHLAQLEISAVYASPLQRALQTAAPLLEGRDLEVVVEEGLTELDRHLTFYVPLEELRASDDPRWAELVAYYTSPEFLSHRLEFRDTVVGVVDRVVRTHPGERVALVCHGGVINAYLSHVLGLEQTLFFEPAYTSISRVLASREGHRQLLSANEAPHLPPVRSIG